MARTRVRQFRPEQKKRKKYSKKKTKKSFIFILISFFLLLLLLLYYYYCYNFSSFKLIYIFVSKKEKRNKQKKEAFSCFVEGEKENPEESQRPTELTLELFTKQRKLRYATII